MLGGGGGGDGGGGGLELVLLARNLALKLNAVPNYKYMFGPQSSLLRYLRTITMKHITKTSDENTPIQIYRKFHFQKLKIFM